MALRVDMKGNATGLQQMLETARVQIIGFSESISEEVNRGFMRGIKGAFSGLIGIEALQGVKEAFSWFTETGEQINQISEQLGMSTDEWQKWSDAVDRAHLSTEGFTRVVEALMQKRTEALTDPKARAQLTQLGFTDAEISGPMSTSAFVQKALQNANMNPYAQQAFDSIAGTMGAKYTRALGYLPTSQVEFSKTDLANAAALGDMEHNVQKGLIDPVKKGIVEIFVNRDWQKAFGLTALRLGQAAVGRGWLWNKGASITDGVANVRDGFAANYRPVVAMRDGKPVTNAPGGTGGGAGATKNGPAQNDPMQLVLQQQQREMAIQDQQRQQRLDDSNRGLMTIGDRFKSIKQEMWPLATQIQQHQDALKTPEGFLTPAQRQALSGVTGVARTIQVNEMRQKYQDELADLQERYNKDKADLRQSPLSFQADSMAKVGLYSASALRFNPVLAIGQRTNQLLEKVVQNTARPTNQPPSDPHRR